MVRAFPNPIIGHNAASGAQVIDGSLKFVKETNHYLTRAMTDGNHGKFTISCWLKPTDQEDYLYLMGVSSECSVYITNTRKLHADFYHPDGSTWAVLCDTDSVLRDPGAFYHLVITLDSSSGNNSDGFKVYVNGEQQPITFTTYGTGSITGNVKHVNTNGQTFQINSRPGQTYYNSFYISQYNYIDGQAIGPGYFGFTDPLTGTWRPKKVSQGDTSPVNDGTVWSSGTKTTTGSGLNSGTWDKVFDGILDIGVANGAPYVYNNSSATLTFPKPLTGYISVYGSNGSNSATDSAGTDQIVLSDGSIFDVSGLDVPDGKWYNFGYKKNITSIRIEHNAGSGQGTYLRKIAVNGVELLDNDTSSVDFGTNGFYLPMDNADDFEIDKSGKGNNYTKTNWAGTDSDPDVVKDSPSGAAFGGPGSSGITTTSSAPSNYATFNHLDKNSGATLSNGNLKIQTTTSVWKNTPTSIGMKTGKFYCEFGPNLWSDSNNHCQPGVRAMALGNTFEMGVTNYTGFYHYTGTSLFNGQGGAGTAFGDAWNDSSSNIIGVAFDADTRKVWFSKNGVWQGSGDPANGNNEAGTINLYEDGTYAFCLGTHGNSGLPNGGAEANFGQKPFKYAPPQGFLPLNSANTTPINVIPRPDQFVGTTIWSGDNADPRQIDLGMAPDLIWVKTRNQTNWHWLSDSVRGTADKRYKIYSNSDSAEDTAPIYGQADSFNDFGFVAGGGTDGSNPLSDSNQSGTNYVCWSWKAGGNKNTFNVDDVGYASAAAAGLDGGNKSPSGASVGTKQGFSILKFTNDTTSPITLSHGLTQAPTFVILKALTGSVGWTVGHTSIGFTKRLKLNENVAESASSNFFNDTAPTSTLITLGANNVSNDFIMYAWHDVPGLQKFGMYSGNSNADGVFVECGFRPSILMIKNTAITANWVIVDSKRDTSNPLTQKLYADYNGAENSSNPPGDGAGYNMIDFVSNGFKLRSGNSWTNDSYDYIYAAWAEAPVSNLYGGQSNAR